MMSCSTLVSFRCSTSRAPDQTSQHPDSAPAALSSPTLDTASLAHSVSQACRHTLSPLAPSAKGAETSTRLAPRASAQPQADEYSTALLHGSEQLRSRRCGTGGKEGRPCWAMAFTPASKRACEDELQGTKPTLQGLLSPPQDTRRVVEERIYIMHMVRATHHPKNKKHYVQ